MKPATPLPWKLSGLGYVSGSKVVLARTEAAPAQYQERIDLSMEDAAYLVHAANAYPRLVAELQRLCVEIPAQLGAPPMKNVLLRELGEQ